jgi:putative endopeptidase
MQLSIKTLAMLLFLTALVSCQQQIQSPPAIDRANMDESFHPADDFYRFVNNGWLEANPMTDEYSRYGAFEEVRKLNDQQLNELITAIQKDKVAPHGSNRQKIRDFFNSAMDTVSIEQAGFTPLVPFIEHINAIDDKAQLPARIGQLHAMGVRPLFGFFATQDRKNVEMNIASFSQGGLGMTDREYYLRDDARTVEIRTAYRDFITTLFSLVGYPLDAANAAMEAVMEIETRLAAASMTRVELRDREATYNKMSMNELRSLAPAFDWDVYTNAIGVQIDGLNVSQPVFAAEVSKLMEEISLDNWRTYLKWNLLRSNASYLSSEFDQASFHFYGKVLRGTQAQQERWKRAISSLNSALGEAVGEEYVALHFPAEAKERMEELVDYLRVAFSQRINQLEWMSDETKEKAQEKLQTINVKIGYPDTWRDYSMMDIKDQPYVLNRFEANRFGFERNIEKIGQPVDRDEWFMSPQTVNAYYSATLNEIVFPAGILQPPFFYMHADDAVNFGAIGMVIGHEMTHGFDDQGRKFAADGNMVDWWTAEDAEGFEARAAVLRNQYDNYVFLDTVNLIGRLTIGENIADLGGLTISYQALQNKLEKDGVPGLIDGFTPEQRYFIAYAQVWRNHIREQELRRQISEGPHPPGEARVNGIVYNLPAFYDAFGIEEDQGKRFIPTAERAKIW